MTAAAIDRPTRSCCSHAEGVTGGYMNEVDTNSIEIIFAELNSTNLFDSSLESTARRKTCTSLHGN
jgi:hypothetical protein